MWRSIASRSIFIRNFSSKLFFHQNPSPSHHLLHKTLNSSSSSQSSFTRFSHQNLIFFSHSSTTQCENETHDPTSSSEEVESENNVDFDYTHLACSSKDAIFHQDFDQTSENIDAQMAKATSRGLEIGGFNEGLGGENEFDVEKFEKVLSLLQSSVDESLEHSLDVLDLGLNEDFVMKVLETPLVPSEHLLRFFKWASSKDEFSVSTAVFSVLARAICHEPRRKQVYMLWDFVKESGEKEKGVVNVEILNELILALSKLGKGKAAFEVFDNFQELGCVPNEDTFYLTIEALCKRSFYDWAVLVSVRMVDTGIIPESVRVGGIISLLCKGRREKEAHVVYIAGKKKNICPPKRSVSFLISCLSKVDETVYLAKEMCDFSDDARQGSINPFTWVIRGLCRIKDIEGAKKLLYEMIEKGPPPGNDVFNTVINSLSKAGELEDAKEVLRVMESRGLRPDVYTYSVIMSGYAKGGTMEEACKVLAMAKKKHRKLCPVTFHTLIRGYCKLGKFDSALKLLSEMKDYGVEANVDEYNKLIQSLCLKALDWETAEKLLDEMKQKGLHLPGITRGLINAVKELEQEAVVTDENLANT